MKYKVTSETSVMIIKCNKLVRLTARKLSADGVIIDIDQDLLKVEVEK